MLKTAIIALTAVSAEGFVPQEQANAVLEREQNKPESRLLFSKKQAKWNTHGEQEGKMSDGKPSGLWQAAWEYLIWRVEQYEKGKTEPAKKGWGKDGRRLTFWEAFTGSSGGGN